MSNETFIGIGHNPDGPDLPLGLGMRLAGNPKAMSAFGRMSNEQKETMIRYLQSTSTGEAAEIRMGEVLAKLSDGQIQF